MAILNEGPELNVYWDLSVSSAVGLVSGLGYDLNQDFGLGGTVGPPTAVNGFVRPGGPARKAPYPGQTGEWLMHFRVTTSFVANAGFPMVMFNAALSEAQIPGGGGNFIIIGSSCATRQIIGTRAHVGYREEQLVAGNQFFVRMNPWTTPMGKDVAFATKEAKDLRWLLPAMTFPTHDTAAATVYFSAGSVQARMVLASDVFQNPEEFIYPTSRLVI